MTTPNITSLAALSLAALYALWVLYVLVMGFYRARLGGRLKGLPLVLASPFVVVGLVLDAAIQITVATVVFRDLPRHWLLTSRLRAYIKQRSGWRHDWAQAICHWLLDPYDPTGAHCD